MPETFDWTTQHTFDPRTQCAILRLGYDFTTRRGEIYFLPQQCCDAQGCIDLFLLIDPNVAVIQTYSGDRVDTSYIRESAYGDAMTPRQRAQTAPCIAGWLYLP
jgi:hypothetical protein